jgi:lipid II:glycine glycyltransferase (peptidoglycan interpeptide bridge formation enzyme)
MGNLHADPPSHPRAHRRLRTLAPGYTAEVETLDEQSWARALLLFDDANIYQTWAYNQVTSGRRRISHLVLRLNGDIVALAQVRISRLPLLPAGIAYVRWGPVWCRRDQPATPETFRQTLRALHNEFVRRRGLALRVFPQLFADDSSHFAAILRDEGFSTLLTEPADRTLRIDLHPPLEQLRAGMGRNWRRNLKEAEASGLSIIEGSEDHLFAAFIGIYRDLVSRKGFRQPNSIDHYRSMQAALPDELKMRIMICRDRDGACAGLIWSEMGKTGIELFAATTTRALANKGSYLLRWKLVETLKQNGRDFYDLNGINPTGNPGGHKFKRELGGKNAADVCFLGRFDTGGRLLSRLALRFANVAKATTWPHSRR